MDRLGVLCISTASHINIIREIIKIKNHEVITKTQGILRVISAVLLTVGTILYFFV